MMAEESVGGPVFSSEGQLIGINVGYVECRHETVVLMLSVNGMISFYPRVNL
jgi:S1-C subfamily serine protease